MNLIKKSVVALVVLVTTSISHAQQPASDSTAVGRLGQRYVGASFGVANFKDTPEEFYDTSIGVNLPVTKSIDVDFGYGYQWLRNSPVDASAHVIDAGATFYQSTHGVKPFASVSLAYLWSEASYAGFSANDDEGLYALSLGVEAPVGPVILTPAISYDDSWKRRSARSYLRRQSATTTRSTTVETAPGLMEPMSTIGSPRKWARAPASRIPITAAASNPGTTGSACG